MSRTEFPKRIRVAAFERSEGRCEACTARIVGTPQYDHILPDALGGEATLANCAVLCRTCHAVKTGTQDVPRIAKATRVREKNIGARRPRQGFRGWRNFRGDVIFAKDR